MVTSGALSGVGGGGSLYLMKCTVHYQYSILSSHIVNLMEIKSIWMKGLVCAMWWNIAFYSHNL